MGRTSVFAALLLATTSACSTAPRADVERARATIQELAGTIGVRPLGSPADARARQYLLGALRSIGFDVRVQEADAVDEARGVTAHVFNVIGVRAGAETDAIALVSHYDSVPDGPGAADDGLGVAMCLEAARQLAAAPLRRTLVVLITDGEEAGLMGARAAATDPEIRARVKAFLNFDGTGSSGPPVLFETTAGGTDVLAAWADGAAAPFGGSFGVEIYRRLPNDTDFTVLRTAGASGLNFAPVAGSYAYHTDGDVPAAVSDRTIAQEIDNTVGIVRRLDRTALTTTGDDSFTFFDVWSLRGIVYSARTGRVLGIAACLLGVVAWVLLTMAIGRERGLAGLAIVAGLAGLALAAPLSLMAAATWLLETARREPALWYAAPWWYFALLAATGAFALWMVGRIGPARSAKTAWWAAFPLWTALAAWLTVAAPGAAYLVTLPLLIGGALLVIRRQTAWIRGASAVVLVVVLTLWAPKMVVLLGFMVPLFGWLPLHPPVWTYPAVFTAVGLMTVPPWRSLTATTRRRHGTRVGGALVLAVVICGVGAGVAAPYTAEHPQRRAVRYVQDNITRQAWWDVGGTSGAPTVTPDAAPGVWVETRAPIAASVPIGALPLPRDWRAPTAAPAAVAPADVDSFVTLGAGGRTTLETTILPREPVTARIVLPRGARPISSSLAGVVIGDRWSAAYAAVPMSGLTVRIDLTGASADLLDHTLVVLTAANLPSGPWAWMPTGFATWQRRETFIVPAAAPTPATLRPPS